MMSKATFIRPPRVAVWLVDLFTPNKQAESIPGDLLEEFSELASKSGDAFARRWYWRQSVKTVAHLIVTGFLVMPWLTAGTVVGSAFGGRCVMTSLYANGSSIRRLIADRSAAPRSD